MYNGQLSFLKDGFQRQIFEPALSRLPHMLLHSSCAHGCIYLPKRILGAAFGAAFGASFAESFGACFVVFAFVVFVGSSPALLPCTVPKRAFGAAACFAACFGAAAFLVAAPPPSLAAFTVSLKLLPGVKPGMTVAGISSGSCV